MIVSRRLSLLLGGLRLWRPGGLSAGRGPDDPRATGPRRSFQAVSAGTAGAAAAAAARDGRDAACPSLCAAARGDFPRPTGAIRTFIPPPSLRLGRRARCGRSRRGPNGGRRTAWWWRAPDSPSSTPEPAASLRRCASRRPKSCTPSAPASSGARAGSDAFRAAPDGRTLDLANGQVANCSLAGSGLCSASGRAFACRTFGLEVDIISARAVELAPRTIVVDLVPTEFRSRPPLRPGDAKRGPPPPSRSMPMRSRWVPLLDRRGSAGAHRSMPDACGFSSPAASSSRKRPMPKRGAAVWSSRVLMEPATLSRSRR